MIGTDMERRDALKTLGVAGLAGMTLVTTSGCRKPTPDEIRKVLEIAGQNGAYHGLKLWAKKDEASAKECATALTKNIKDVLLPYLDGGNLPASSEIQAMINSSLFKNIKPEIKQAILLASMALDQFLPIPTADKFLNKDQVSYIKAFLKGLSDGCDSFLSRGKAIGTVWLK